ncbi:MAG UNVERIFIED_CONTAM: hypothetical protein LVR18_43840 [Planctomycetaceae bacterium]|jgi:hypothetical protein
MDSVELHIHSKLLRLPEHKRPTRPTWPAAAEADGQEGDDTDTGGWWGMALAFCRLPSPQRSG